MTERQSKVRAPRKRALVSCDRCKTRRARCIRNNAEESCADCNVSGVLCESKLPRKQRVYGSVETLSLRYRALEALVKGLFPQENIHDVDALYKLAADRNISMPASDDFTPADIFNNKSEGQAQPQQQQQEKVVDLPILSHTPSDEAISSKSTNKDDQRNPFSEIQSPIRGDEGMVPTSNGVPHYFGPSSSFRLATTIRALVTRYRAASGVEFSISRSDSSGSASNSESSLKRNSTNISDEEYVMAGTSHSPSRGYRGRKRSRTEMEGTIDQRERRSESPNPDTIGDFLPSRFLADTLTAAYFENVHVQLPLFNISIFQLQLEDVYSRKMELLDECPDIGWLVVLALVFAFGCHQLQDHDPVQAHKLRQKFLGFTKTHFRQLLTRTCLTNVQALVLLNHHHHTVGQKSTSWLLIGLAARMAITMGMHRDGPNREFDQIERNTRRQVWWSIYTFEKSLCCILGRPTVVDEKEMTVRIPDGFLLNQKGISSEVMSFVLKLTGMAYNIRQRAYFDETTAEERSPTPATAKILLQECDEFFQSIPAHLAYPHAVAPEQRAPILMMHVGYYYMRCIVSRDFLMQKIETNICHLENKTPPLSENWQTTLALSEDCVESAHKSLQYMSEASNQNLIGASYVDLFYVFHSVLLVCADFLARPKDQSNSSRDVERKVAVCAVLKQIRGMDKPAPTYRILNQIALQFASITGVEGMSRTPSAALDELSELPAVTTGDEVTELLAKIPDTREEWFAKATMDLGLDFFDLNQAMEADPPSILQPMR